jgi:MYXO-CTERM domain-containing protein
VGPPAVIADKAATLDDETFLIVTEGDSRQFLGWRLRGKTGAAPDVGKPIAVGGIYGFHQPGTIPPAHVAYDGTNALVIWSDFFGSQANPSSYGTPTYRGVRVHPSDGVVLDATPVPLATTAGAADFDVAFDGKAYVIASLDSLPSGTGQRTLSLFRVTPDLVVLDAPMVVASTSPLDHAAPALARGPSDQMLVAYSLWSDDPNDVGAAVWGRTFADDWAGIADAGVDAPADTSTPDASTTDASTTDASAFDASTSGDGAPTAPPSTDASALDDASTSVADASSPVTSPSTTDASVGETAKPGGGCSCTSAGTQTGTWPSGVLAMLVPLAFARRRRTKR